MKKSLVIISVLIAVAAALPIVGNTVMKNTIETRVSELNKYGLKSINTKTESTYLSTKKHFEFTLEDAGEFVNYLSQYSDQQIPSYVNAMLEGLLIGADLEYSNLPFSKAIELDIYPLALSKEMAESLEANDIDFAHHLVKFLHSRGVLYHINYDIVSENFNGYVKNINESHVLKDGTALLFSLDATTFNGNGKLIAPSSLTTFMKKLELEIKKDKEALAVTVDNLATTTNFESKNTYISSIGIADMKMFVKGTQNDISINMSELLFAASSNTQGEYAELDSKSNIKHLKFISKELIFDIEELSSDVALNTLDKKTFDEIQDLVSQARVSSTPLQEQKLEESLFKLISKGFVLDIADMSVKNITLNANEKLKGFSIKSELKMNEDPALIQKLQISPMLLISDVALTSKMKFSKEIYAKLTQDRPMTALVTEYIKEDKDNILFDLSFINGELTLNGKTIK
jgi:hypothetical protein